MDDTETPNAVNEETSTTMQKKSNVSLRIFFYIMFSGFRLRPSRN